LADTIALYDERSAAILEAVKLAFAEKGFDGASMQDLARAAGMSAGNFYRYFPSKSAIVAAMIARDLDSVGRDFEIVQTSNDPLGALKRKFVERIDNLACENGPLWSEIDAVALRSPEIGEIVGRMEREVQLYLTAVFARISGLSPEAARLRFSGHAAFLMLLFKGASYRLSGRGCQLPDDARMNLRDLIISTIDRTLTDIASPGDVNETS